MILGVVLVSVSLWGIYHGIRIRKVSYILGSAMVLALTIAVWIYFYVNPY